MVEFIPEPEIKVKEVERDSLGLGNGTERESLLLAVLPG